VTASFDCVFYWQTNGNKAGAEPARELRAQQTLITPEDREELPLLKRRLTYLRPLSPTSDHCYSSTMLSRRSLGISALTSLIITILTTIVIGALQAQCISDCKQESSCSCTARFAASGVGTTITAIFAVLWGCASGDNRGESGQMEMAHTV
jgi:hypothetical protein